MPRGIGETQRQVLAQLRRGPMPVREIAEAVGRSPGTVRQSLKRLHGRGLVEPAGKNWSTVEAPGPLFERERPGFDLLEFLSTCLAFVEQDGYLSRADASLSNRMATPDRALGYLAFRAAGQDPTDSLRIARDSRQDWIGYRLAAKRVAFSVLDKIGKRQSDAYEARLVEVLRSGLVAADSAGFAASIFGFEGRFQEKKAQVDWSAARDSSDYFGNPGDRLNLRIKVNKTKDFDGYYCRKTMVQFLTDRGVGVWWASSVVTWAKVGEEYDVRATVSDHRLNEHGGIPFRETVVKCVKLQAEEVTAEGFAERLNRHG